MHKLNILGCWEISVFFQITGYWLNLHTVPMIACCLQHSLEWSTLVPALRASVVCLWNMTWMKSRVRVAKIDRLVKTKANTQLESLSLSQATWILDPLNSICTFSDSDPVPRPQLLTPDWMNLLTGITLFNVWNADWLLNLSWVFYVCVCVCTPRARSPSHTWDVNKGYTAKSVWKRQVKQT